MKNTPSLVFSYMSIKKIAIFSILSVPFFAVYKGFLSNQRKYTRKSEAGRADKYNDAFFATPRICRDSFELSILPIAEKRIDGHWPCLVQPPVGYPAPGTQRNSLWKIQRGVLGKLNASTEIYNLYINHQRWAKLESDFVYIKEEGGTAGRAFKNNFEYVKVLQRNIHLNACNSNAPPLLLDMGGGIGSVGAAIKDPRGGNSSIRTVTYVLPDDSLRLQAVLSHRGLPSYVAKFNGTTPFPASSFHIVHCKWCWHHLVGYDKWLREVNRIMTPRGYFVFTFTPTTYEILKYPDWEVALQNQGFECTRKNRIILICQRSSEIGTKDQCQNESFSVPKGLKNAVEVPSIDEQKSFRRQIDIFAKEYRKEKGLLTPRLLNINCRYFEFCRGLETHFQTDFVMHLGHAPDIETTSLLIKDRKIAMTHDWDKVPHIPMYPRSFDIVLVGCTKNSRFLVHRYDFWADIHRLLSPEGVVGILTSMCWVDMKKLEEMLRKYPFRFQMSKEAGFILATRLMQY